MKHMKDEKRERETEVVGGSHEQISQEINNSLRGTSVSSGKIFPPVHMEYWYTVTVTCYVETWPG